MYFKNVLLCESIAPFRLAFVRENFKTDSRHKCINKDGNVQTVKPIFFFSFLPTRNSTHGSGRIHRAVSVGVLHYYLKTWARSTPQIGAHVSDLSRKLEEVSLISYFQVVKYMLKTCASADVSAEFEAKTTAYKKKSGTFGLKFSRALWEFPYALYWWTARHVWRVQLRSLLRIYYVLNGKLLKFE